MFIEQFQPKLYIIKSWWVGSIPPSLPLDPLLGNCWSMPIVIIPHNRDNTYLRLVWGKSVVPKVIILNKRNLPYLIHFSIAAYFMLYMKMLHNAVVLLEVEHHSYIEAVNCSHKKVVPPEFCMQVRLDSSKPFFLNLLSYNQTWPHLGHRDILYELLFKLSSITSMTKLDQPG